MFIGTPLHIAIIEKRCDILDNILPRFSKLSNCLYVAKSEGRLPIHLAATRNSVLVKWLLDFDIEQLNLQDNDGNYPQHFSAITGNIETLVEIMKYYPTDDGKSKCLSALNNTRCTPLYMASASGYVDMVKYILDVCPDSALIPAAKSTYPIHIACQQKHYEVCYLLLNKAPQSSMFRRLDNLLPLNMAVRNPNPLASKFESKVPPHRLIKLLMKLNPEAALNPDQNNLNPFQILQNTEYYELIPQPAKSIDHIRLKNSDSKDLEFGRSNRKQNNVDNTLDKISGYRQVYASYEIRIMLNGKPDLDYSLYHQMNYDNRKYALLLSYPELPSQHKRSIEVTFDEKIVTNLQGNRSQRTNNNCENIVQSKNDNYTSSDIEVKFIFNIFMKLRYNDEDAWRNMILFL